MPTLNNDLRETIEARCIQTINYEKERNMVCFRFNDLKDEAQDKFVKLLKNGSSIWTVRNNSTKEIKNVLSACNPRIIRPASWRPDKFSGSSIYKWGEVGISRLIYYCLNRRNVDNSCINHTVLRQSTREDPYSSRCVTCGQFNNRNSGELCQDCFDIFPERENRMAERELERDTMRETWDWPNELEKVADKDVCQRQDQENSVHIVPSE